MGASRTTVGESTCLGLDISYRVVTNATAATSPSSPFPGDTCFQVRLFRAEPAALA
jgi:hypothetical protein